MYLFFLFTNFVALAATAAQKIAFFNSGCIQNTAKNAFAIEGVFSFSAILSYRAQIELFINGFPSRFTKTN
ncbi:hypothetical protein CWM47_14240 [Spirosoma pollinicola]|uniref:Secreted protein n=1 Tax=Spirosoma pollinicola TaxID=2057025 RepID=A0A2K8YZ61_9BACT|nr:hypothetical protein CWM47_14240 [Spirosoma pollinicola]